MAKVNLDDLKIRYVVFDSNDVSKPDNTFHKFQNAFNYVEKACSPGSWICIQFYDKENNLLKNEVIYETEMAMPFSIFGGN